MKKAKMVLAKLLNPPKWVLIPLPIIVFATLIFIFVSRQEESAPAYVIYVMSAYCLAILIVPIPGIIKRLKNGVKQRISGTKIGVRYISDLAFRESVSIYMGMFVDFFYVVFRIVVGIRYASVWFVSMAVYYLVLGSIRLFLVRSCRRHDSPKEVRCYRMTAWMLFLLNIPMGGMIVLMVVANNGYSYPGYVIYISAMYTFCMMIMSVINLVRYHRLGSPLLSAAKVLNFIAALMSILGLQTAMIAEFSVEDDSFRRLMNGITGAGIWVTVIVTAVYMLIRSSKMKSEVNSPEQVRK